MANYTCESCGYHDTVDKFVPARDMGDRFLEGDIYTEVECPECGSLAHSDETRNLPQYKNWLIWSVEHDSWWKPNHHGYTVKYSEAGRYTFWEAIAICKDAGFRRSNFAHYDIRVPNECMFLEKEEEDGQTKAD